MYRVFLFFFFNFCKSESSDVEKVFALRFKRYLWNAAYPKMQPRGWQCQHFSVLKNLLWKLLLYYIFYLLTTYSWKGFCTYKTSNIEDTGNFKLMAQKVNKGSSYEIKLVIWLQKKKVKNFSWPQSHHFWAKYNSHWNHLTETEITILGWFSRKDGLLQKGESRKNLAHSELLKLCLS